MSSIRWRWCTCVPVDIEWGSFLSDDIAYMHCGRGVSAGLLKDIAFFLTCNAKHDVFGLQEGGERHADTFMRRVWRIYLYITICAVRIQGLGQFGIVGKQGGGMPVFAPPKKRSAERRGGKRGVRTLGTR